MIYILIALNLIDIIATYIMVFQLGAQEVNPYVDWSIQLAGIYGLVVMKTIPLYILWQYRDRIKPFFMDGMILVYSILAVLHFINLKEIL